MPVEVAGNTARVRALQVCFDGNCRMVKTRLEENRWEIHLMMRSPQNITIRALAPNQEILAEQDYELEWVRVGGSEECGGPAEAESVTLHL
ncbi:hypothetical protein GCM10027562_06270 [Arthrobacter pigmenti]